MCPTFCFGQGFCSSTRCSIDVTISWRIDNLRRRWERQRSLFAILIRLKLSEKSKSFVPKLGQHLGFLEAQTQWANRAELYVGLIKEATRKDMQATGSPLVLWDFCMERRALIFQITAKKLFQLNGTNPYTMTFGTDADILNLCQFG
jgi:hypothetical protein